MAVTSRPPSRWRPWAGLVAGMLAAGLQHQGVSDALHFGCGFDARLADLAVGVAALVVIAVGAWMSRTALGDDGAGSATRRFIVQLSLMGAALFALMVAWQTLAGFVVPACPR